MSFAEINAPGQTARKTRLHSDGRKTSENDGETPNCDAANPITTSYTYDAAGNLLSTSGAKGNFTYTYDNARNRVSMTDGNNNKTTYVYDVRKRLTETDYPDSTKKIYAYDGPGNLTLVTDQANNQVQYSYDAANQLVNVVELNSPNTGQNTTIYGYDGDGNPIGRWPRSRCRSQTTLRVPPVPRFWGPGREDSLITVSGFTTGVSSHCMKGQRIRYQQTGEFHFLTFSCYRRRPYLAAVAVMELFEDALERVRQRYLFAVAGYVVMPEHVGGWPRSRGMTIQQTVPPVPRIWAPGMAASNIPPAHITPEKSACVEGSQLLCAGLTFFP